jgi:hypothetical protein
MTFLHVSLLAGGLLALVPIALHMLGRRQPKALTFPAIRFVRQTAIQAQKGWAIKRWLLLSLRVLLILLAAFALASPRVPSQMFATYLLMGLLGVLALLATAAAATALATRKSRMIVGITSLIAILLWLASGSWLLLASTGNASSVLPTNTGPIAAAIIIDTSPSMSYLYKNETRLAAAKETAGWLMDRLPNGSQIAIVNSDATVRLLADRASANRILDKTIVEGRASGLVQRITNAIDALRKSELERREIYVLSDMNAAGWQDADTSSIGTKLAKNPDGTGVEGPSVLIQLVDVSVPVEEIKNWGIKKLRLSQQSTVPGSQVTVGVEVEGFPGSGQEQMTVELLKEKVDRDLVVRNGILIKPELETVDRQLIEVPDGGSVPVQFAWKGLAEGINHAQIKIMRPDPLDVDNVVYLSVEAKAQGRSLIVANDLQDAKLIVSMIDPDAVLSEGGPDSSFPTAKTETFAKLGIAPLSDYSNIVLYDPVDIDANTCDKLQAWVEQGGGLMIVLGSSYKSAESLMESPIQTLLPGIVKRITRRSLDNRQTVLTPAVKNHPIWSIFERPVEEIPWVGYPVFRHWDIEDLKPTAFPLMRFTQSELPALTEEIRKQGRIVTWSLPYPEPVAHKQGEEWSELFRTTSDIWPGFALFDGSVRYLASWSDQQLNYSVDQPAALENNTKTMPQKYLLFDPNGEQSSVDSGEESMLVSYTRYAGPYRLKGLRTQGPVVRGFSVNVDPKEIRLDRASVETLDAALGKENVRIAKDRNAIESSLGEGRSGRDLTPYFMVLVVMLFMAEQTMASRFYSSTMRSSSARNASKAPSRGAA